MQACGAGLHSAYGGWREHSDQRVATPGAATEAADARNRVQGHAQIERVMPSWGWQAAGDEEDTALLDGD